MRAYFVTIASCLVMSACIEANTAPPRKCCSQYDLVKQPAWISSVVLDEINDRLVMADPKEGVLWECSTTGELEVVKGIHPSPLAVTKAPTGFLVSTKDDEVLSYDHGFGLLRPLDLSRPLDARVSSAGPMHAGWISNDDFVLGYGALQFSNQGHMGEGSRSVNGFILGKLTMEGAGEVQLLLPFEADSNVFYRIGLSYFAANEDSMYFVQIGSGETRLWQVRPRFDGEDRLRRLDVIPAKFRNPGAVGIEIQGDAKKQLSKTAQIFSSIEQKTMIAGVYTTEDSLYLLARSPLGEGRTRWVLLQVDPEHASKPPLEVRLPSEANHINVVAGRDRWYIIEKGVVEDWGVQEIGGIISISTDLIHEAAVGARELRLCGT